MEILSAANWLIQSGVTHRQLHLFLYFLEGKYQSLAGNRFFGSSIFVCSPKNIPNSFSVLLSLPYLDHKAIIPEVSFGKQFDPMGIAEKDLDFIRNSIKEWRPRQDYDFSSCPAYTKALDYHGLIIQDEIYSDYEFLFPKSEEW